LIAIPTALSIILFLFAANEKEAWMAVFETISWTLTAIIIWYLLLNPVITKFIQFILLKRQSRYNEDVLKTLSFLPVIRLLSIIAWKKSAMHKGWERWQYFIAILLYWLLTYSNSTTEPSLKKQG
jgi:hypothetical protein